MLLESLNSLCGRMQAHIRASRFDIQVYAMGKISQAFLLDCFYAAVLVTW